MKLYHEFSFRLSQCRPYRHSQHPLQTRMPRDKKPFFTFPSWPCCLETSPNSLPGEGKDQSCPCALMYFPSVSAERSAEVAPEWRAAPEAVLSHPGASLPARLALRTPQSSNVLEKQQLVLMSKHIETAQPGLGNKILSTNENKIYFIT